jgi:hypothetical protein
MPHARNSLVMADLRVLEYIWTCRPYIYPNPLQPPYLSVNALVKEGTFMSSTQADTDTVIIALFVDDSSSAHVYLLGIYLPMS